MLMRRSKCLCGLLFLAATGARAEAPRAPGPLCGGMPVGFHEFAVFGSGSFYISHYAAFSSIHAYQVIAEVRLSAPGHDAAQRLRDDMAAHPGVHYTLSPYRNVPVSADRAKDQDDWVLPEKVTEGKAFNADVHYRSGGKDVTVDSNVRVEIARVIVKRLLDPKAPHPTGLRYVAFGEPGDTAYLAHELAAPPNPGEQKPDFDQILAVRLDGAAPATGTVLTVDGRADVAAQALKKGDDVALTAPDGHVLRAGVDAEVLSISVPTER